MKYRIAILDQLKTQPYFDKQSIRQLGEQLGIKESSLDSYIVQSIKHKDILPLRKGLYVSTDFYDGHKRDISYTFFLANVVRRPSYISSWTALQYYDLTTEIIRVTTSVTTKLTREYRSKMGSFSYHSIKKSLFSGFTLEKRTFDFFIASPAKALFDLLYFRTLQFRNIRFRQIERLIDELRIDIDEMDSKERESFYEMIKGQFGNE